MGNPEFIPNSYQTPNVLIDRIMPLLSPQEWVVLSFATRHILGWKDKLQSRQAPISVSKFQDCGLSKSAILTALGELEKYHLLSKEGKPTPDGQVWHLSYDEAVDFDGLQERQDGKRKKSQGRTQRARSVRQTTRQAAPSSVPQTDPGLSDRTAGGLSDRNNKTQEIQTQDQTQSLPNVASASSASDPLADDLDKPITDNKHLAAYQEKQATKRLSWQTFGDGLEEERESSAKEKQAPLPMAARPAELTPTSPAKVIAAAERAQKKAAKAPAPRPRDPVFDVVASLYFKLDKMPKRSAKWIGTEVATIRGCQPDGMTEDQLVADLRALPGWYKRHHPDIDLPKKGEKICGYLSDMRAERKPAAPRVKPVAHVRYWTDAAGRPQSEYCNCPQGANHER